MASQIGIVVWGCKGGYRMFCTNGVVRTDEPSIAQTVKDIRSFVRINRAGVNFYAIEFTDHYKVFTIYRSSFDSGSGAFTAITVYVPHQLRLLRVREMLGEMMDAYFREYMNPLTYAPIPGKYDDISRFTAILDTYSDHVGAETGLFRRSVSVQDDTPQIILYDKVEEVDAYFEEPYHPEFFACQEVMLFEREVFEKQSEYQVVFGTKPKVIEHVSPAETLPTLAPFHLPGNQLTKFVCNGRDLTGSQGVTMLNETDYIDFTVTSLQYADYCEPFTTGRVMVKHAVANGWIVSDGRNYRFADQYLFKPKPVMLPVSNDCEEVGMSPLMGLLTLADGAQAFALSVSGGQVGFMLPGDVFFKETTLRLKINEGADGFIPLTAFKPMDLRQGVRVNITRRVYTFDPLSKRPQPITAKGAFGAVNVMASADHVALYLPVAMAGMPVQFSHPDYKCDIIDDKLSFTLTKERVDIDLGGLEKYIGDNALIAYRLADQDYSARYDRVANCYYLMLPIERDKAIRGDFSINRQKFRYQFNDNGSIGVQATLLINDSSKIVDVSINNRPSIKMKKGDRLIYPSEQQVYVQTRNMVVTDDLGATVAHPLITVKRITGKKGGTLSGNGKSLSGDGGALPGDDGNKPEPKPIPFWKSKLFLLAAPAIVLLLGVGLWLLLFRSSDHTLTMNFIPAEEKYPIEKVELINADILQPKQEKPVEVVFAYQKDIASKIVDVNSLSPIQLKVIYQDKKDGTYRLSDLLGKERFTQFYDFLKGGKEDVRWELTVPVPRDHAAEVAEAETTVEADGLKADINVSGNDRMSQFKELLTRLDNNFPTTEDIQQIQQAMSDLSIDQNIKERVKAYATFLVGYNNQAQQPDPAQTKLFTEAQQEWCNKTINIANGWDKYKDWCSNNNRTIRSFQSLKAYYDFVVARTKINQTTDKKPIKTTDKQKSSIQKNEEWVD